MSNLRLGYSFAAPSCISHSRAELASSFCTVRYTMRCPHVSVGQPRLFNAFSASLVLSRRFFMSFALSAVIAGSERKL